MPHPKSTTKKKEVKKFKAWGVVNKRGKIVSCNCHNGEIDMLQMTFKKKQASDLLVEEDNQLGIKIVPCIITLLPNKKG